MRDPNGARCLLGAFVDADAKADLYRLTLRAAHDVTGVWYSRIERFNDAKRTDFTTIGVVLDKVRAEIVLGSISHPRQRDLAGFLNLLRNTCRGLAQTVSQN
jgi:hypothetical protein